jgi:hypothetical protein
MDAVNVVGVKGGYWPVGSIDLSLSRRSSPSLVFGVPPGLAKFIFQSNASVGNNYKDPTDVKSALNQCAQVETPSAIPRVRQVLRVSIYQF